MSYSLLFLFVLVYVIVLDRNVADYLYLKFVAEPALRARTELFKIRLLIQLRYDTYLIKRGYVSRKYVKMAKELSKELSEPK